MTQPASLGEREIFMLGDANGTNIGRIGKYNMLSFYVSSDIPFANECYWVLTFPEMLPLDGELSTAEGQGIF